MIASVIVIIASTSLIINYEDKNASKKPTNFSNIGLLLVPYFEPTDPNWKLVYDIADRYPGSIRYAIINPCSGPCDQVLSNDWQRVIQILKEKNVKTLGYIFDTDQSFENIDYYMQKTKIKTDGIFFDNEGNRDNYSGFKQYSDYVKSLDGLVFINPGFNYPHLKKYFNDKNIDMINLYEFESDKFHHINFDDSIYLDKVSVILGNISNKQEMKDLMFELSTRDVGIMYFYEDSYQTLPSFFEEMVKDTTFEILNNIEF